MRRIVLVPLLALVSSTLATPALAADATEFVVVLKESADPAAVAARHGARTGHVYTNALKGFSATLTSEEVRELRNDKAVAYVEESQIAHTTEQKQSTGVRRVNAVANAGLKVGDGRDERVDADVAVLDSGVDIDHPDLNVVRSTNCLNASTCADNTGDDDNGHGSNVAGIIGALDNDRNTVGVAPGARLWSAKVLNSGGSGNEAGIIAGIDWVTKHADEIDVVNLSLGFQGTVQAVNDALNRAIAKGVVVVVSAGNDRKDVRGQTPANLPDAITVSSLSDSDGAPGGTGGGFGWCNSNNTNRDDTLSNFSNFGPGVDLAAPGDCIESTWKNGGRSNYSGTSQAAPHVAGAVAWLTTNGNKPADRAGVLKIRDTLVAEGNFGWTDTSGDNAKEPLLDLSDTAVFPPKPADPGAPAARFSATCSDEQPTCDFDGTASSDPDGSITGYAWDFGDGATGSGRTATHRYVKSGYYSVTLTVTDNAGKTHKLRQQVKAGNLPPTAAISANNCISQPKCTFDGAASSDPEGAALTYRWDFGDGASATGIKVEHTYPSATANYTVKLTVTDTRGQTATAQKNVDCRKFFDSAMCYSS